MKRLNLALLVVVISFIVNVCTVSSNPFEAIGGLIKNLIHPQVCRSLNYADITPGSAKQTITTIDDPYGTLASGNDVYINRFGEGVNVFHFNSKEGDGVQALEATAIGAGSPVFNDINDGFIYVANYGNNRVYRKPLLGGEFAEILTVNSPYGIKWSPDGTQLLVGEWNTGIIHIYDRDFQEITSFTSSCTTYPREISFDLDGNIRLADDSTGFCIHSKDDYSLLSEIEVENIGIATEGHLQHCDGTIILADRGGRVHFLDKDYKTLRMFSGFDGPRDVALTDDGTLYVTDYGADTVYLYSLY